MGGDDRRRRFMRPPKGSQVTKSAIVGFYGSQLPRCEVTGKVSYPSKSAARAYDKAQRQRRPNYNRQDPYECPECDRIHLTTRRT